MHQASASRAASSAGLSSAGRRRGAPCALSRNALFGHGTLAVVFVTFWAVKRKTCGDEKDLWDNCS